MYGKRPHNCSVVYFSAKDLVENPGGVAAACQESGEVHVAVSGFDFSVTKVVPLNGTPKVTRPLIGHVPDFAARREAMGMPALDSSCATALDNLIAGEER